MALTSADIVNRAILLTGNRQDPVTGSAPTFDDSAAGVAARYLYPEALNTVARQFEWDFSRRSIALTPSGNAAPFPCEFTNEYLYPTNGIEVWQLRPATLSDRNNPAPVNFLIGNTLVTAVQTKVIWANFASAVAIYNNNPGPDLWDANFVDAVVRFLASGFAMALAGRPETSANLLQSAGAMMDSAKMRDG
jgi:hypothetical protein